MFVVILVKLVVFFAQVVVAIVVLAAAAAVAAAALLLVLAKFLLKINFLDEMMSLLSLPRDYRLSRVERGLP